MLDCFCVFFFLGWGGVEGAPFFWRTFLNPKHPPRFLVQSDRGSLGIVKRILGFASNMNKGLNSFKGVI